MPELKLVAECQIDEFRFKDVLAKQQLTIKALKRNGHEKPKNKNCLQKEKIGMRMDVKRRREFAIRCRLDDVFMVVKLAFRKTKSREV